MGDWRKAKWSFLERINDMLSTAIQSFTQWLLYTREFRIPSPGGIRLSIQAEAPADIPLKEPLAITQGKEELLDMIADIATLLWRVQKRLYDIGQLPKELNRISRDLESTENALNQGGIEIKDHTGQEYATGMSVRVIASQPLENISKNRIIETLRPTIYYKDKIIQKGEVVVGIPRKD